MLKGEYYFPKHGNQYVNYVISLTGIERNIISIIFKYIGTISQVGCPYGTRARKSALCIYNCRKDLFYNNINFFPEGVRDIIFSYFSDKVRVLCLASVVYRSEKYKWYKNEKYQNWYLCEYVLLTREKKMTPNRTYCLPKFCNAHEAIREICKILKKIKHGKLTRESSIMSFQKYSSFCRGRQSVILNQID